MAWSYSGNPSSSDKDRVRFMVGDTRQLKPLLQDEEIQSVLDMAGGNVGQAAVDCVRAIIVQLARLRDETVGSVSISFSQQFDHYMQLLDGLQAQLGMLGGFTVYAGGTSLADSYNIAHDPDRIPPDFAKARPHRLYGGTPLADQLGALGRIVNDGYEGGTDD